jgi:hypothetical protein
MTGRSHFTQKGGIWVLNEEELRALIQHKVIGQDYPYSESGPYGNNEVMSAFMERLNEELQASGVVRTDVETDSFGCGYASFFDFFCYPANGSSEKDMGTYVTISGIGLYVSRLGPFAIIGGADISKSKDGRSASRYLFDYRNVGNLPSEEWVNAIVDTITITLNKFKISVLPYDYTSQLLPFEAKIETNLGDPPYRVYDAIFNWMD